MLKKNIVVCLVAVFAFSSVSPALALDFRTVKPIVAPTDLEFTAITPSVRPIVTPEPDEPGLLATSTVIVPVPEDAPPAEEPETDGAAAAAPAPAVPAETDSSDTVPDTGTAESGSVLPPLPSVTPTPTAAPSAPSASNDLTTGAGPLKPVIAPDIERAQEKPAGALSLDFSKVDVGALLDICGLDSGCSGDMGMTHWQREVSVRSDNRDRDIRYSTGRDDIKEGLLQVSYYSFVNNDDPRIVYSRPISTGVSPFDAGLVGLSAAALKDFSAGLSGKLSVAASNAFYNADSDTLAPPSASARPAPSAEAGTGFWHRLIAKIKAVVMAPVRFAAKIFYKSTPVMTADKESLIANLEIPHNEYYLRVVPTKNGRVVGAATNEAKITLTEPEEQSDLEFYAPAKIYEVKIRDFEPIRAPAPGVCTGAVILDTDWVGMGVNKKAGDRVCPATYQGVGEQAWYELFWDFAKSGLNWISEAYNALKSAVVDAVAGAVCGGDPACKMAISAGLDIGLAAMGIPPTIPNFDELVDGGFDYLASEIAAQAGCPDVACKELIKDKLRQVLDSQKNTNPACLGAEEAHRQGIEPLCLPPGVKAHPDPLATHRNAQVTLEIKRNNLPGGGLAGAPYRLYFYNGAHNAGPVGSSIHNIEPYGESVAITEPLQGQMFEPTVITVPPLEPGEMIAIPIVFTPAEYWVPGHKEAMHGWSTVVYHDGWPQYQYDDWWKLYYGGTLGLSAYIDGCDYSYGYEECIISSDSLTVTLPNTINP
ncbi:hypothetical protein A2227_06925 [Candidatus Falkowbacteria bacterium RIFOXYA2_FULL_47_19]|uniref:Uncharacterized protein n=1 Tax=Candidatus Falkowbacteria bacterium RIFOXYA2_FULL_47_19 TaxID=1797994 RepID=A0A1F5SF44_9BACT|nr:MAG: hypothetical protein A2227_06925 [Candidatus Falkowbacteria bacterium RIFOXYA2_FULL_47_19]